MSVQDIHCRSARKLSAWAHVEDDYGAIPDGVSSAHVAFQAAIDAVSAGGGGTVVAGEGPYLWGGTVTMRPNVHLVGVDGMSRVIVDVSGTTAALAFQAGICRAHVTRLRLDGNVSTQTGRAFVLSGSQFNRLTHVIAWDFTIGLDLSDGVLDYSGYNSVIGFEMNRCKTGIRAYRFCNSNTVKDGRVFWSFDGANGGRGIDIQSAIALHIEDVDVESFDTGIRIASTLAEGVIASFDNMYVESGADGAPGTNRQLWDLSGIDWANENTKISYRGSHDGGHASVIVDAPPDAALDWDSVDQMYFGSKRHPAGSTHDNMVENGDFLLIDPGTNVAPGWFVASGPTITRKTGSGEYETNGQAMSVKQATTAGDTYACFVRAPERTGWISCSIRYQVPTTNGTSNAQVSLTGGTGAANAVITHGPTGTWKWITLQMERAPSSDGGLCAVNIQPDLNGTGKEIWIDRVVATAGRVAPSDRLYGQRIQMLEFPQEVLDESDTANMIFSMDPSTWVGLSKMPLGAVGMIIAMHAEWQAVAPEVDGDILPKSCFAYLNPRGQTIGTVTQIKQHCLVAGEHTSGMYTLRFDVGGVMVVGTINNTGTSRTNRLRVDLHGWILPH
jgi:hypothetical protein